MKSIHRGGVFFAVQVVLRHVFAQANFAFGIQRICAAVSAAGAHQVVPAKIKAVSARGDQSGVDAQRARQISVNLFYTLGIQKTPLPTFLGGAESRQRKGVVLKLFVQFKKVEKHA